ncbi:MAG: DUF4040 domain-containing protein [Candidatus Cloacimonetes bacterium]|nr:DUF4040 domain-containing protein [Candidatus Cloacimonadota bacterium]
MLNLVIIILLSIISLSAAIYAVRAKKLVNAVVASGVISLMASIVFLVLGAPDVAMTEASIGSGLTTVVFLYALKQIKSKGEKDDD